ncbi:hypothetical protein LOTGIDRAFT_237497 [Lottia gigantea]|uniref:PID domain-containing protein n=1 Tax=Lottia gigantea TaxID=225164 RepID=V4B9Q7_LOTGI|nr:hypothetical protein LOTGIDRAFT_237497 [Lottia gigantea]ESP04206.1 hypothetical protein LOTGIDRAFT_237497 [Lottia gigantea]
MPEDQEDHLPRYQGQLDEELTQNKMDGYTFTADYLGNSTISKPPTALSIIQPPVKDLYIKCQKKESKVQQVKLRIIPGGLIFTFSEGAGRGEVFFDINSMIYFEGLRFQMVRTNEKKPHAMFVPLDESKMTQKDQKSAFVLDKNLQFLAQLQHPPMLTCVLRRPKGIKALDCHLFVFESVSDVTEMMSLLSGLQAGGGKLPEISDFRQTETNFNRGQKGDVIRTEYGDYAIYRGNQMELKDDFFRPREENGAFDDRRDGRPDERHDDRRDGGREESERKVHDWDYDSSPIDNAWRSVHKQFTEDDRNKNLDPNTDYRRSAEFDKPFVAHSRDRSGDSNDGRYSGRNLGDSGRYDERQLRPGASPHSKVPPPVAHKPASPRPMSPTGQRFGYGGPPQRDDRRDNPYNPIYGGVPPDRGSQPGYERGRPLQDRGPPPHDRGSRFHDRGPPLQERGGPVYSASNLEGRGPDRNSKVDEEPPSKPVAKVPPHLVAGIKVLPTNFNPQGVKLKPRSPNVEQHPDKHFEKPHSEASDDVEYDNVLQKFDKMISDESSDYKYPQGRPSQNDREIYDQNIRKNWANEDLRYNQESPRLEKRNYGPDHGRYDPPEDDRRYIEQYEYQRRQTNTREEYYGDPRQDPKNNPNRYSMPIYDRGERSYESPNRWSGSNKSQSSYEMGGRSQGLPPGVAPDNPDHNNRKDAEIANMFGGHPREHYDHFPYKPMPQAGTNFEQSLGYYP